MRCAYAVFLFVALVAPVRADALPAAFLHALADADIPLTAVSLVVQRVDSDIQLLSYRPTQPMSPASVMKLVTSLAALDRLGSAYTWKTELWADGDIRQRTLHGNLVVKGYGDPTLTLERMWLLQRELHAHGVDTISGDLILDTRYFDLSPQDPGAFDGDPLAPYNAAPGALVANYGATPFRLVPTANNVAVTPEFYTPQLTLNSRLLLDDAACGDWQDRLAMSLSDTAGTTLTLDGHYARACGEKPLALNVFAPSRNFDALFRALWMASGGVLIGNTRAGNAPVTPPLVRFESIPLAEALRNQNKYSSNLMARNLFLTLGVVAEGAPATLANSTRAVRTWLADQGIAAPELVLENGAGLSRNERISALTLARLLRAETTSPTFSEFESSLPLAGVDGTLRRRFKDTDLTGHAHLKTGTLRDARTLAGYVHTRTGQRLVFVLFINDAHAERGGAAQQALLEWAYNYGPPTD
jgi:D-alanyl-D-alanine carboxypeptidase/D-alanyl-D-alanine-endopeptidase (penicillin-binding protein 4)